MGISKHTSYNVVGAIIPVVVSLATIPLYLKLLGIPRYGVLALCWTALAYMGSLSLGLGPALTQRMAKMVDGSAEQRASVFWTAFWLASAMGVLGMAVTTAAGWIYFRSVGTDTELIREVARSLFWLGCIVPLVVVNGVLRGALQGRERFLELNVITSGSAVLTTTLPLAVAWGIGPELYRVIPAALAGNALSAFVAFYVCVRTVPLRSPQFLTRTEAGPLLTFGGWVTIAMIVGPMLVTFDRFVIGGVIGPSAVSFYVVAYNLVALLSILPQALSAALFPRLSYADTAEAQGLQDVSLAALTAVLTPAAIATAALAQPFLQLWISEDFARHAAPIVYIFIFGFWCNSFANVPYSLLYARGRPDLIAKLVLIYLVPYYLLLVFLLWTVGLLGAAIAWTVKGFLDVIILFWFAGQLRRALPRLFVPGAFVLGAAIICLFAPEGGPKWAALAVLFVISCFHSLRILPDQVKELLVRTVYRRP